MNRPLEDRVLVAALDEAADFVIVSDDTPVAEGGPRILYVNQSYLDASGFSREEIVGKTYDFFLSPRNPPQLVASIRRALAEGAPNSREALARKRDESDFWIEFVGKQFRDGSAVEYRLTIARDITLRRRSLSQVALLFAATEQSSDAIALYEPDGDGLALSYENDEAYRRARPRLPELWETNATVRETLEKGGEVHEFYAELAASGKPELIEFRAHAVRSDSRIEAVVTLERRLTSSGDPSAENYESRMIKTAGQLTTLGRARSHHERVGILRAILLDAFGAEVTRSTIPARPSVQMDVDKGFATFKLGGDSFTARWEHPLESTSLTALRFCIEAAIEQDGLPKHRRRS